MFQLLSSDKRSVLEKNMRSLDCAFIKVDTNVNHLSQDPIASKFSTVCYSETFGFSVNKKEKYKSLYQFVARVPGDIRP